MIIDNWSYLSSNRIIKIIGIISALILLSACGGSSGSGDDDDDDDAISPPQVNTGVFLDSAVEGLTYQSGANPPRTTDVNGMFSYTPGEALTFSIGGVVLGTLTDGASVITPFDFDTSATVNIARFLQTLDADGDPSNGIDLTAAAVALMGTALESSVFMSDTAAFETEIVPALEAVLGSGALLIDEVTAIAHLVAETASPFKANELRNHGLVVVFPETNDIGFMNFVSSSTVEIMWKSDTIDSGGDGAITMNNWSLDVNGSLVLTEPIGLTTMTIEKVESSAHASSIIMTVEAVAVPIIGTILAPIAETVHSLAGESGRTYDLAEDGNSGLTQRITIYPDGTLSRVDNGVQINETWNLNSNGNLITILKSDANKVGMFVMMNGSFTTGGDIFYVNATNLSGDPTSLNLQLDAMNEGTFSPLIVINPDGTIPYSFSAERSNNQCPTDPIEDPSCDLINFLGETMTVEGTFDYNPNWISGLDVDGAWYNYKGSITNLTGTLNLMPFSASDGRTAVINDGFDYFVSHQVYDADFLLISPLPESFVGFEAAGSRLVGIDIGWTEGRNGATDFLPNSDLPALLPGFQGGITLNFKSPEGAGLEFHYHHFSFPSVIPFSVNPEL